MPETEKKKPEERPAAVEAFDVIVKATSKYLRSIFPHIFELSKKK